MLTLTTEADLVVVAAVAATAELLLEVVVLTLKMFACFRFTKVKCDDINDTKRFRFI
jgi:hypothetical protein